MDMLLRNYSAVGVLATPGSPENEAVGLDPPGHAGSRRQDHHAGRSQVYAFADVPAMIAAQGAPAAGKAVVRVAG